jgi:hypothetical protein
MNITVFDRPVLRNRVHQRVNHNHNIIDYGINNLYPQLMNELYKGSPLTKACIRVMADFINGEGFEKGGDKIVNQHGETWDDILHYVSYDLATFNGFALHFNYNALGQIIEIKYVPFEYCRLGMPNEQQEISKVLISNNWEEDSSKEKLYKGINPKAFTLFNPKLAAEEILTGRNTRGQILYYTTKKHCYPLASFDAIRDSVQTDAEIQTFSLASLQNGFHGTTVFKYPGQFKNEEEKRSVENKVRQMIGTHNANSVTVVEVDEEFRGDLLEVVPAPNMDKMFEITWKRIRDTILQNYATPGPLMGVNPEGGIFTQQAIRDSFIYMNARTKNPRLLLERILKPVGKLQGTILGKIKEQVYEIPGLNMPKLDGNPDQLNKQENEKTNQTGRSEGELDI